MVQAVCFSMFADTPSHPVDLLVSRAINSVRACHGHFLVHDHFCTRFEFWVPTNFRVRLFLLIVKVAFFRGVDGIPGCPLCINPCVLLISLPFFEGSSLRNICNKYSDLIG